MTASTFTAEPIDVPDDTAHTETPARSSAAATGTRSKTRFFKGASSRSENVLNVLFTLSVVISCALLAYVSFELLAKAGSYDTTQIVLSIAYLGLMVVDTIGCLSMVVFDYNTHLPQARMIARATAVSLLATIVVDIVTSGLHAELLQFAFQLVCIISFQSFTDDKLARNVTFNAPWDISDDTQRRAYIPLNFFNIFWVFTIASICGLVVEVLYHAIVFGGYQDRAGLLWGPFSPIYGFGAVLMTVALNRYWNRNAFIIFLIAGLIGAAFEFCVSWLMETAFGIVAWDYSGTFLSIQGRTNFAFFCAWGFLGVVWIKLILPDVLKIVDAIPLKVRAWATIMAACFLIVDGAMTLTTIDCWYQRESGNQPATGIETFCATHYGNDYMADRFQSMSLDPNRAERVV
jgi:uncharacterized membrane protein